MREVSRFVIGDVLKTSLWIYSRNLPTVVVLAAIASAPMFAVAWLAIGDDMLGFVALIVPGIILILVYWVVVPVAAVERGGVVYALKRSHELTKGHKGRILAIVGLLLIPSIIIAGHAVARIPWALGLDWSEATRAQAAVVVEALILSVEGTVIAVCYHNLRVLKDGYDSGRIAEVFA